MLLDGEWKLKADPEERGELKGFYRQEYDDSSWDTIIVPSHWQDSEKFKDYSGVMWYRKTFEYQRNHKKRVWIVFYGVFYEADVWLNGVYLGKNKGYFFPFKFDVTDIIKKINVLVVRVSSYDEHNLNSKKQVGGVFYHWDCRDPRFNPGGIWRSVEVVETNDVIIERAKFVTLDHEKRYVKLLLWVNNYSGQERNIKIRIEIAPKNFEGKSYNFLFSASLQNIKNFLEFDLNLPDSKLWWTWDLGFPHVYKARITISDGDDTLDMKEFNFGIRSIKLIKSGKGWQFFINGVRIFLRGTNYGPTDQRLAKITREDIIRDAKLMRNANINAVRIHAHVNPLVYDVFDEFGILIWQDMPLQWLYSKSIRDDAIFNAKKLVEISENHPSVAVYCCHNEPFKFPDAKDLVLILSAILISIVLSALFGSLSTLLGIRFFSFNLGDIISFSSIYNYVVSFLFMFVLFPMFALLLSGVEAIVIVFILSLLVPWDISMFLVILLWIMRTSPILYVWNWNKNVLDRQICKVISSYDYNSRPVVRASGIFGWFLDGTDTHLYFGWYTGWLWPLRGYKHLKILIRPFDRVLRLVSEFGAQAFPSKKNLKKMLPNPLRDLIDKPLQESYNDVAQYLRKYHQYQPDFMKLWVNPKKFYSWDEFIDATQKWQASLIKFYIEYLRARKYSPTGGIFQFMFTDIAPLITWAILDYWREPKEAYHVLKLTYEPLLGVLCDKKDTYRRGKHNRLRICIINDYNQSFADVRVALKIDDINIFEKSVSITADSVYELTVTFTLPSALKSGEHWLNLVVCYEDRCIENPYEIFVK